MSTNTPSGQESTGEPRETYHLVCRDCTHEDLHDSWRDAYDGARDHLTEESEHTVHFEGIQ